jgi:hypothetical protein
MVVKAEHLAQSKEGRETDRRGERESDRERERVIGRGEGGIHGTVKRGEGD